MLIFSCSVCLFTFKSFCFCIPYIGHQFSSVPLSNCFLSFTLYKAVWFRFITRAVQRAKSVCVFFPRKYYLKYDVFSLLYRLIPAAFVCTGSIVCIYHFKQAPEMGSRHMFFFFFLRKMYELLSSLTFKDKKGER